LATEHGIVIKLGTDTAWVRATKSSACEGCASKDSCTAVGEDMEVEALNVAGAGVGDRIVLSFATSPLLKATFLIYVVPILCMIIGAVIGLQLAPAVGMDPSAGSAVSGFLFFFVSVIFIKFRANKMAEKEEYRPKITRILKHS